MKRTLAILLMLALILSLSAAAFADGPSGKVMLYSSMQEAQLQAIEQAFEAKYPGVDMEYYYAGGGKLVTKMTTEAQDGGQIASDLVWLRLRGVQGQRLADALCLSRDRAYRQRIHGS